MKFKEPSLAVEHIGEPELEFGFEQRSQHPKDGLFLYGPHAPENAVREVRIGVVGAPSGIKHFRTWANQLIAGVGVPPPGKGEKQDRLHLADFPGLREAFGITFDPDACSTLQIPLSEIDRATLIANIHEAVDKVARLYIDRVRRFLAN